MTRHTKKLLVVQVAALGYDFLVRHHGTDWKGLTFQKANTVFPALTCPVQASFRTGTFPDKHGMISNGLWDPTYARVRFWEQAASLIAGPRIWEERRTADETVAMLFWQQSLGEAADLLISPAPIHKHHGGMIQDAYSQPPALYSEICDAMGRSFCLPHYWGPFASTESSEWITQATLRILEREAPTLCLTYLPALDYDLQRFGTDHARSEKALRDLLSQLTALYESCEKTGYDLLIYGDYAMADCPQGAVFPNRLLRERDLLSTRAVQGRLYPDFYTTAAFCMVDHEIAHVHVRKSSELDRIAEALAEDVGIDRIIAGDERHTLHMNHPRSGELILVAKPGYWFAYPWWSCSSEAPDYAGHVDIHNKPGYDPCELFLGWPPGTVSQNTNRIRGSHGRTGSDRQVAWTSTWLHREQESLVDLSARTKEWLQS